MKFWGVALVIICHIVLCSFAMADTGLTTDRIVTPTDEAMNYVYADKALRTSELANALWDTTISSMATSDTLTVDFSGFATNFQPLVISLFCTDDDAIVMYYGSAINALTGGDNDDSYLRADVGQNWRISGLDSVRVYPSSATIKLDVFIRGVIDQ